MEGFWRKKDISRAEMVLIGVIVIILIAFFLVLTGDSLDKTKASADAADMRTVWEKLNTNLMTDSFAAAAAYGSTKECRCRFIPDAVLMTAYEQSSFMDVYYYKDGVYYGRAYFSEVAELGTSEKATTENPYPDAQWYVIGQPFENG